MNVVLAFESQGCQPMINKTAFTYIYVFAFIFIHNFYAFCLFNSVASLFSQLLLLFMGRGGGEFSMLMFKMYRKYFCIRYFFFFLIPKIDKWCIHDTSNYRLILASVETLRVLFKIKTYIFYVELMIYYRCLMESTKFIKIYCIMYILKIFFCPTIQNIIRSTLCFLKTVPPAPYVMWDTYDRPRRPPTLRVSPGN